MIVIKRDSSVHYSPRQMFELVNNVEEYPRFLPWCQRSEILSRTDHYLEAQLEVVWSGIHKQFTTRNYPVPDKQIDIQLVEGPFKHLEGKWTFTHIAEGGCYIQLVLEFELAGSIFDRVFQPIFHHMANSLVDLFCKRAVELYG